MAKSGGAQPSCPPGWIVTFADLMSLLVCFFVLLLSFSIMDVQRFFEVSGSMQDAFGIQKSRLFSSVVELIGSPVLDYASNVQPVPIPTLASPNKDTTGASEGADDGQEAESTEPTEQTYDSNAGFQDDAGTVTKEQLDAQQEQQMAMMALTALREAIQREQRQAAELGRNLGLIQLALQRELEGRMVDIDKNYSEIVITFPDEISFRPGSDQLTDNMFLALNRLADVLAKIEGQIIVGGHTDETPINSARYRDNWDLSSARAVTVVRHFQNTAGIDPRRLEATGYGDTRPVASNATLDGRIKNRRVEVVLRQEGDGEPAEIGQRVGGWVDSPPIPVYPPGLLRGLIE